MVPGEEFATNILKIKMQGSSADRWDTKTDGPTENVHATLQAKPAQPVSFAPKRAS